MHSVYVLDRRTNVEIAEEVVVPFARGAVFPPVTGGCTRSAPT